MMNKNGGITKLHIKFTQRVLRIQMVMDRRHSWNYQQV